ncbi:U3 small nucleolar RNA-associated protein 18 homolog [Erpetoichthys calabaricus]|uniref:U3 small nucleolar RNA-associated protein 18 homolog n=1 Tax=Erpetoichthys calabaricus TaxID=27687 RepID=A0A8C4TQW9_ERPCA|nr:U3 small nucleolar RNA-associated protein 18 homolog [Erpetoichthys calabaricus]XP_051792234.1 U3 small nucleolar RNA-associated protein 18 homolog [Erpetoichthys calabaricus]
MEGLQSAAKSKRGVAQKRGAQAAALEAKVRRRHIKALGEKDESERYLEELVFGAEDELIGRLCGADKAHDTVTGDLLAEDSSDAEVEDESRLQVPSAKRAAWEDEDDEADETIDMTHRYRKDLLKSDAEKLLPKQKFKQRLKEQFQKAMGGTPAWAESNLKKKTKKKGEEDSDEDEDNLLQRTGNFVAPSDSLPRGIIEMKKCLNANNERPSDAKLTTVKFHPAAQVIMTAGFDQSISLFQVDGKTNPKIQSIHLEKFPVFKARFSADGEQVIATSMRNKMFYVYDMMGGKIIPVYGIRGLEINRIKQFEVSPDGSFLLLSGRSGYLHLLTMKTKELVASMKINGNIGATAFSPDGSTMYAHSDEGEVFIWDVKSRKCINKFTDDGCLRGTSIAASRNGQYVACGSSSGVVNVYPHDACLSKSNPKPLKAIMNLVTSATSLVFNPQTEILAIASDLADDAVKLVHIPSFTVFSNFPLFRKKSIHLAQCMDFSPRSGFFSVASNKGKALLYRLKHYTNF